MVTEVKLDASVSPKRGRPRAMTADELVQERRRMQLRVAQQRYRRRKETRITNLRSRIQGLESGIEELSLSFLSFTNLLFDADIVEKHPRVTSAFHQITQQCVSLANEGCNESDQAFDVDAVVAQLDGCPMIGNTPQSSLATLGSQSPPIPPTPHFQEQGILPFEILLSSLSIPLSSTEGPPLTSLSTTILPSSFMKQGGWTLSHRLVRECYENGYRLLINSSGNDPKVQAIFGRQLGTFERKRIISAFYAAIHDEVGDVIELKATVLSPLRSKIRTSSTEKLAISSPTWQMVIESASDEWLDASGVQNFLQEKGIQTQDSNRPDSSPRFTFSSRLHLAFVRFVSLSPICVGRGPAFRRRDIEYALHLATSEGSWPFDITCDIP